jgi:hypothetical protein
VELYFQRLQKLQKEFIQIKKSNKWRFDDHHQAIYDFVIHSKNSTSFTIDGYHITLNKGNEHFGFKHILLRHYCDDCDGKIKAIDILKIGNIIKNGITVPTNKRGRIKFIQTKNNEKYTLILQKRGNNKLIFTFFSSI